MRRAYVFRLRPTARQHVALAACVEVAPRVVQRGVAGASGCVVAQQDPDQLRGSVGAADRYPVGAPGSGGVVVFQSAGHAAAVEQGVCRVFPPGQGAGRQPGYPRFKGKARFDSVEWPKDGDGARWLPEQRRVYLQGIGQVKVHLHRQVRGRVKTIQIKRQGRRWMLVLSCDDVRPIRCRRPAARPASMSGSSVSPPPATVSTSTIRAGDVLPGPVGRGAAATAARQTPFQEPRTQAGNGRGPASQNRQPAQGLSPQAGPRTSWRRYDLLVVEDLQIANMLRRAKPVPDPDNPGQFLPNGARAKSGLNRSISDAGWGQFVSILRAKAEDAGRTWIEVDPRHTSDGCENCGHAAPENRVTQAEFVCQRCGHIAPRQTNTPHATSSGLDWPFTPKRREKKPAASSRRRSHLVERLPRVPDIGGTAPAGW